MNKIVVIGCPGSGKSYFSKKLKEKLNIPLYHLDMIWNKEDKTTLTREEFDIELKKIFDTENWIMDGNYQRTLDLRISNATTVILLDYSLDVCLNGATSRVGIKRDDMPWKEDKLDENFKQYIIKFSENNLPEIYNIIDKYKDSKEIIIFKSREEADEYLNNLK